MFEYFSFGKNMAGQKDSEYKEHSWYMPPNFLIVKMRRPLKGVIAKENLFVLKKYHHMLNGIADGQI